MNQKLIHFLETQEDSILRNWHAALTSTTQNANAEATEASPHTLNGFYSDLIALIKSEDEEDIHQAGSFYNLTHSKLKLKLPFLIKLFLTGEDLLYQTLFSKQYSEYFSDTEMSFFFQKISWSTEKLILHYSNAFCEDCYQSLTKTRRKILGLVQKRFAHRRKMGEPHAIL